MLLRANPKGGRPLSGYPYEQDPHTAVLGYKIGYCGNKCWHCGRNCAEPIVIPREDLKVLVNEWAHYLEEGSPKITLKQRFANWLLIKARDMGGKQIKSGEDAQVEDIQMRAMQEQYKRGY
jgi:hypothetical protein